MTRKNLSVMLGLMLTGTYVGAQQTHHVYLEPDTAHRKVVLIENTPVTADLYLHAPYAWLIGRSAIIPSDDCLWLGPVGDTPSPDAEHLYHLLSANSSREYVKISGILVRPGTGAGRSPWFRVTVPAVDMDWEGHSDPSDETAEDTLIEYCPVTNDRSQQKKLLIRASRDDNALANPTLVLSWQPANALTITRPNGTSMSNGGSFVQVSDTPLELYVSPVGNVIVDCFTITLKGPATDGQEPTDVVKGACNSIELVTPEGDPVNAAVSAQGTDGQNEFTYSEAAQGVLTITLKAKVTPSGSADQIKDDVRFTVGPVGDSAMAWDVLNPGGKPTASGDYLLATVRFTGLPSNNSSFGAKKAAVYYLGKKRDEADYEVFYPKTGKNHPGTGSGFSPNWFYYWNQTPAGDTHALYDVTHPNWSGATPAMLFWMPGMAYTKTEIWICDGAAASMTRGDGSGQTAKGIDWFANTIVHERYHVRQISDADGCLSGVTGSLWAYGWSWNTQQCMQYWNHYKPGPNGNNIVLDVNSNDVPDTWELSCVYNVEVEARKQETITDDTYYRLDWSSSGKQF